MSDDFILETRRLVGKQFNGFTAQLSANAPPCTSVSRATLISRRRKRLLETKRLHLPP